jgi:hypothetical protein
MEIRTLFISCGHQAWIPLENIKDCKCPICDSSNGFRATQGQDRKTIADEQCGRHHSSKWEKQSMGLTKTQCGFNCPEPLVEEHIPAPLQEKIEKMCIC